MLKNLNPLARIILASVFLLALLGPLVVAFSAASGADAPRLTLNNVATQGTVLYLGPSTVGSGTAVVGYGYNTPEFPRAPWSFQREQVVAPQTLAKFRIGQRVPVEYASASPGSSRLKGYGKTRSVLLDDRSLWLPLLLVVFSFPALYLFKKMRGM